jgi:methylmalonyl-CoA mutase cobalamin-binding domain/chain
VVAGGIIPAEDAAELQQQGISAVLGPGSSTGDIIAIVRTLAEQKRQAVVAD